MSWTTGKTKIFFRNQTHISCVGHFIFFRRILWFCRKKSPFVCIYQFLLSTPFRQIDCSPFMNHLIENSLEKLDKSTNFTHEIRIETATKFNLNVWRTFDDNFFVPNLLIGICNDVNRIFCLHVLFERIKRCMPLSLT